MKPWRPYWKALDCVKSELSRHVEPPPFSDLRQMEICVQNLNFCDLAMCDSDCVELLDVLTSKNIASHSFFEIRKAIGEKTNWQLILRFECALDFCRGNVGTRKDFNWNQTEKAIYRWLLIDLWRENALHWLCKVYGSPMVKDRMRQFHLTQQISQHFHKGDPTKN